MRSSNREGRRRPQGDGVSCGAGALIVRGDARAGFRFIGLDLDAGYVESGDGRIADVLPLLRIQP